jgi:hypothetical protein
MGGKCMCDWRVPQSLMHANLQIRADDEMRQTVELATPTIHAAVHIIAAPLHATCPNIISLLDARPPCLIGAC